MDDIFRSLVNEAQFTGEMLGAGATRIGKANYASRGVYFEAFSLLSIGLERIGKLCVMLDYWIEYGSFPENPKYIRKFGHNLEKLYAAGVEIAQRREIEFDWLSELNDSVHQSILSVLSDFAVSERYANLDQLLGASGKMDPMARWVSEVDEVLFDKRVSERKKKQILKNASLIHDRASHLMLVQHQAEDGSEISSVLDASMRTGKWEATAKYRRLYVLQVVRFWWEILRGLEWAARNAGLQPPFFGDIFGLFTNDDSYFLQKSDWQRV